MRAPASCGVVSQLRSKLRYQLMPPVKPVRSNAVDVDRELGLRSSERLAERLVALDDLDHVRHVDAARREARRDLLQRHAARA